MLLSWFPAGGADTPMHFVLPVLALALPYAAAIARLTRGSVGRGRARAARAHRPGQGAPAPTHPGAALSCPRPSSPSSPTSDPRPRRLLTGSVIVEQIFDLPGIGRYFVQGALARDYTLVMGVVIVYSFAILLFNLLVDLAYGWLDPRMRASVVGAVR